MKKKLISMAVTLSMMLTMIITASLSVSAAAPIVEDVELDGKSRVEVDFYGKVQYRNLKITVKDTSGKSYTVSRIRKDNDEVDFTINKIKTGKTYKISIKGVRERGTSGYGTATCKLKVPAATSGKAISASKAVSIAKKDAKNKWKAKGIWDVDVERDRYRGQNVWEVSFSGTIGGEPYEFEYEIARKGGKILHREKEYDD